MAYLGNHALEFEPVETDNIGSRSDGVTPPLALDVFFEFHSERAVIPCGACASVNFAAGVDESAALGEADDVIECGRCLLAHYFPFVGAYVAHTRRIRIWQMQQV